MVKPEAFELDPGVIEAMAKRVSDAVVTRVLEVLSEERRSARARRPMPWLDAQEVARQLGVSRDWVYEHANELGASRVGAGPRPRLRFPPDVVDSRHSKPAPPAISEPTAQRPKHTGLIPIRGS
jgi:hypothetical protein